METLTTIANTHTELLTKAGYTLRRGWNRTVAQELVELSTQPHIIRTTPNDAAKRFASVDAAEMWHIAHARTIYTIGNNALAGLIWFGEASSEHVEGDYTIAIRMYAESQGRHLARPFMNAAHENFRKVSQYDGAIWLDTAVTNYGAIALYEKTGYTPIQTVGDRVYMTQLPQN